jgi:hypothetical protein
MDLVIAAAMPGSGSFAPQRVMEGKMNSRKIRELTAARDRLDAQLCPLDAKMILASSGHGPSLSQAERASYDAVEAEWGIVVDEIANLQDKQRAATIAAIDQAGPQISAARCFSWYEYRPTKSVT